MQLFCHHEHTPTRPNRQLFPDCGKLYPDRNGAIWNYAIKVLNVLVMKKTIWNGGLLVWKCGLAS